MTYKTGDQIVILQQEHPLDPPPGSVHAIKHAAARVWIDWRFPAGWDMPVQLIRLATPEEISRAQLTSLEGL